MGNYWSQPRLALTRGALYGAAMFVRGFTQQEDINQ